jgi:hypothetical protein
MRKLCFTERPLEFSKIAHKSLESSNSLSSLFFFSLCLISSLASPFFSHGQRSLSFFPPSVRLQDRRRPGGFLPSRVQRQSGSAGARGRRRERTSGRSACWCARAGAAARELRAGGGRSAGSRGGRRARPRRWLKRGQSGAAPGSARGAGEPEAALAAREQRAACVSAGLGWLAAAQVPCEQVLAQEDYGPSKQQWVLGGRRVLARAAAAQLNASARQRRSGRAREDQHARTSSTARRWCGRWQDWRWAVGGAERVWVEASGWRARGWSYGAGRPRAAEGSVWEGQLETAAPRTSFPVASSDDAQARVRGETRWWSTQATEVAAQVWAGEPRARVQQQEAHGVAVQACTDGAEARQGRGECMSGNRKKKSNRAGR